MKHILPILILLAACGSSDTEVQNKTEVESVPVKQETIADGEFISNYDDGSVKLTGTIVNGQRSGTWTSYHRNGNKASENEYSNGLLNGKTVSYYEDGIIRYIGYYTNDEKAGVWQFFNSDGTEAQTENYSE